MDERAGCDIKDGEQNFPEFAAENGVWEEEVSEKRRVAIGGTEIRG